MERNEEDDLIDAMFLNILLLYAKKKQQEKVRRIRRWRVRPVNRDWASSGYQKKVFHKIKELDEEQFFLHTRMDKSQYGLLLNLMTPYLTKDKEQIHAEERLAITLQHLAHGTSIQCVAWSHKLGKTTVRNIVLETCEAMWSVLSPIYLSDPTEEQYKSISRDFSTMWNMPNCVGAIEGKHIAIKCPPQSGSLYCNYKKFYSIVLMAACDAKYTFTSVSIGAYGSQSDGGILRNSKFGLNLIEGKLPLPPSIPLPSKFEPFPHYFVRAVLLKTRLVF